MSHDKENTRHVLNEKTESFQRTKRKEGRKEGVVRETLTYVGGNTPATILAIATQTCVYNVGPFLFVCIVTLFTANSMVPVFLYRLCHASVGSILQC